MSKNPITLTFLHFPKFTALSLINFGMNPEFDHVPPECTLLKLHYPKFDVSRLIYSKGIKEKPLGVVGLTPSPFGKGRVKMEHG